MSPERTFERRTPRAHLVLDDFFDDDALDVVFRELASLERRLAPGLVRDIGHDGQSVFFEHPRRRNRAVWIHDPSKTLRLFRERLWAEDLCAAFDAAREPLFQIIPNCHAPHLQVSSYLTGDHYAMHEDEGAGVNLTAIVFLAAEPERIRGGDLELAYEGRRAKVRFRHNRLVIFPSKTPHRVTRVRVEGDDPKHARVSLQCWLAFGKQEMKAKRRAPEADRPTFLLVEEAILAAARAMSDASGRAETPESVYWGAFYVSRILTSNLRCIVREAGGLTMGPIRIRRRDGLEVYARGKLGETTPVRVGFRLGGPDVPPREGLKAGRRRAVASAGDDALTLFVEATSGVATAAVPATADEEETASILADLCARVWRSTRGGG